MEKEGRTKEEKERYIETVENRVLNN